MNKKQLIIFSSIVVFFIVLRGIMLMFSSEEPEKEKVDPVVAKSGEKQILYYDLAFQEKNRRDYDKCITDCDGVRSLSTMSVKDAAWNFFGFLRAKEYEKAALMFEVDQYVDFFFRDYNELSDYEAQLITFGKGLTKDGRLRSVFLTGEAENNGIIQGKFELHYKNMDEPIELTIDFAIDQEEHSHGNVPFIHTPVEEILNQLD